jgi:hypothetical protein
MLNDQKIQNLELSFYQNPSIDSANNLIKNYIIYNHFIDAIDFIDLLPAEYQANNEIQTHKTLINFSMMQYWQRNKDNFLNNIQTTAQDLETLATIAFLSNQGDDFFKIYKIQLFTKSYSKKIIQLSIKMSSSFEKANHIFENTGYKDDIDILSAMLFACAKLNKIDKANEIFESIPASYFNSPEYIVACEMMLLVFLKNNRIEEAVELFKTVETNAKLSKKTLLTMIKYSWNKTNIDYYLKTAPDIQESSTTRATATFTKEIISTTDYLTDEINGTKPFAWTIENLLLKNQTKTALSLLYHFIKLSPENNINISTYIASFLQYFFQFDSIYGLTDFLSKITKPNIETSTPYPLISHEQLIITHGEYILKFLVKKQATQAIILFYTQWKNIRPRAALHAIFIEYFRQNKLYALTEQIHSELQDSDEKSTTETNQQLMSININNHNWPIVFETYQNLKHVTTFWQNTNLLIQLFKYSNENGFYNFSYMLLEEINLETIKQHTALQEQVFNLCLLTANFLLFEELNLTNKPQQLIYLNIIYFRKYIENSQTSIQNRLIIATFFNQQQALNIIQTHTISLDTFLAIKDFINPYFSTLFDSIKTKIKQQKITSSVLEEQNILFKLESGSWPNVLPNIKNSICQTTAIAKLHLQTIYITQGFESAQQLYATQAATSQNLNIYTEGFLTILLKSNKLQEAIDIYMNIKQQIPANDVIKKIIVFCLTETNQLDLAAEILIEMKDPESLNLLLEKDNISVDLLNVILDAIPSTYLTYFFRIKALIRTNKEQLKKFVDAHLNDLNIKSANLILQSANTLNELVYWIANFPSKTRNQNTFLSIMQSLLKNNFNKSQAINIWQEIIEHLDLNNISIRFFKTQLQLKYQQDVEIPEQPNIYFWKTFLHQLATDKLVTIYNRVAPDSFFNQYFFKIFTKKATIENINQLKNKHNIKDILKALLINKRQINIDLLLAGLNICDNEHKELQLEAAIGNNNQQKIITTLNHLSQTSVPQELRSIAKKALAKIWNKTKKTQLTQQLLATTPALFYLEEKKECKKAAELSNRAYLTFNECANLNFVTPLDFSNLIKVLQELLLQHQNNRTGFDFEQTKFTKQFTTAVLYPQPTTNFAKDKTEDVYNFGIWCINNFLLCNCLFNVYNITDFKQNVSEDIWCILMSCINEDYLARPSVEELLQEFTKTHNTMLTQCNL